MIRALFLDDEPLALRQLERYAAQMPFLEVVAACTSASAAKEYIPSVDVLFIDINMPDITGLDFVRSLEQPPLVVFTTAYAEYALEGFRVNAVGYLLKPFSLAEFREVAEKVKMIVELHRKAEEIRDPVSVLYFKTDYKTVPVSVDRIQYVESMSEYLKLYLDGQEMPLVVLYSLKRLMEQLPEGRFMRVHRSYIIPLDRIREANASVVVLDNGTSIPVGESYRAAFKEYLASR
ncbi:MAG: LytTR family DNA-binding domain-containing protein [Bacteroidales bacterium]|nr:LytTR family DNA-binding domain-containing protein [Bacteroidales bacterium]